MTHGESFRSRGVSVCVIFDGADSLNANELDNLFTFSDFSRSPMIVCFQRKLKATNYSHQICIAVDVSNFRRQHSIKSGVKNIYCSNWINKIKVWIGANAWQSDRLRCDLIENIDDVEPRWCRRDKIKSISILWSSSEILQIKTFIANEKFNFEE